MTTLETRVLHLAKTPQLGPLTADIFASESQPVPPLQQGEILVRTIYLSIDAGSRAKLDPLVSYPAKIKIGEGIGSSGCIGEVIDSRHPAWRAGDLVATTTARWQSCQIFDANSPHLVARIDRDDGPLAMHLGALGMVGFTAYIGIFEIGKPKAGETVLVSAAAGATGALAGQYAKISGARVVGIAGGPEKCAFVKSELGFDDCIDYKHGDIRTAIRSACPGGIDVYYENVGGDIQKAAFEQMNPFGRIAMCGMVGQYGGEDEQPGPNLMFMVNKRLTMRGFLSIDHWDLFDDFRDNTARWYKQGRISHHATITRGLDNIHEAINSLTAGRNIGKQLCQVGDE